MPHASGFSSSAEETSRVCPDKQQSLVGRYARSYVLLTAHCFSCTCIQFVDDRLGVHKAMSFLALLSVLGRRGNR